MRRFYLQRNTDVSGISGTGRILDGVQFSNGKCVLQWNTDTASIGLYESIDNVIQIHGHNGLTELVWIDEE